MAEVLLYHHAQGQTPRFLAVADRLRAAGHAVHIPDLYDGNTFASLEEAVGYAKEVGFGTLWSVVNKQLKTCRQSSLVDYDDRLRKLKERVLAFLKSVD